jgi:hypothetical protein
MHIDRRAHLRKPDRREETPALPSPDRRMPRPDHPTALLEQDRASGDITVLGEARTAAARETKAAAPELPAPPEAVVRVLRAGVVSSRLVFPGGEDLSVPSRRVERWVAPVLQEGPELNTIMRYLAQLEAALPPAPRERLLGRILALISHYPSKVHPPEVEQAMAEDWADDLGGYHIWVIEEACRRWRQTKKFRPQISEMMDLCEQIAGETMQTLRRVREVVERSEATENPYVNRMRTMASLTFQRMM